MQFLLRLSNLPFLTLLLGFTGCGLFGSGEVPGSGGRGGGGAGPGAAHAQSDVWGRSAYLGSGESLGAEGFEADLHGRFSVASDRALVRVSALAVGADRVATSAAATSLGQALVTALSEDGICEARVVDHDVVRFRDREDWRSDVSLRVDVLLTGLESVSARAERLEHCLARIDAEANGREEGVVRRGAPLLTLDHPEAHRDELLTRAFRDLRAIAAASETPAQFHVDATRCTSAGHVSIRSRSLSGVVLGVDLDCQPHFSPSVRAPEPEADVERL
jgi:hypothetical protein